MSSLTVYSSNAPDVVLETLADGEAIANRLKEVGVTFERWTAKSAIADGDNQEKILQSFASSIQKLKTLGGYTTEDVVSIYPEHPDKEAMRAKFLSEHTHSEDEVRFFVRGSGLFCLHIAGKVYAVLCEQGDLISVPKGITHWFDMGSKPYFTCIRLFTDPAGWVAQFTGSDIASKVPNMDSQPAETA